MIKDTTTRIPNPSTKSEIVDTEKVLDVEQTSTTSSEEEYLRRKNAPPRRAFSILGRLFKRKSNNSTKDKNRLVDAYKNLDGQLPHTSFSEEALNMGKPLLNERYDYGALRDVESGERSNFSSSEKLIRKHGRTPKGAFATLRNFFKRKSNNSTKDKNRLVDAYKNSTSFSEEALNMGKPLSNNMHEQYDYEALSVLEPGEHLDIASSSLSTAQPITKTPYKYDVGNPAEAMLKFLACAKLDLSLSDHCNQVKISCEINHSETQQWELNHSKIQKSEHKISIKVDGEEIDPSKLVISSIQNEKILLSFDGITLIVIHVSALSNDCIKQPLKSMRNAVLETEKLADQEISFLRAWEDWGLLTSNPKKGIIKVYDSEDGSEGEFTALLTPSSEALKNQGIKVLNDLSFSNIPLHNHSAGYVFSCYIMPILEDFLRLLALFKNSDSMENVKTVTESGQIKVVITNSDIAGHYHPTSFNRNYLKYDDHTGIKFQHEVLNDEGRRLRLFFLGTTDLMRNFLDTHPSPMFFYLSLFPCFKYDYKLYPSDSNPEIERFLRNDKLRKGLFEHITEVGKLFGEYIQRHVLANEYSAYLKCEHNLLCKSRNKESENSFNYDSNFQCQQHTIEGVCQHTEQLQRKVKEINFNEDFYFAGAFEAKRYADLLSDLIKERVPHSMFIPHAPVQKNDIILETDTTTDVPKTDITSSTCSDVATTEEHSVKRSMAI